MRGKIQAICVEGRGPVGAGSWPIEDWAGRPGRPVPLRRRAARICSEVTGTVPHVLRTHRTFPCDAGSPGAAPSIRPQRGPRLGLRYRRRRAGRHGAATNAVQHAGSQYSVELSFEGATATVEVSDASGRWPAPKDAEGDGIRRQGTAHRGHVVQEVGGAPGPPGGQGGLGRHRRRGARETIGRRAGLRAGRTAVRP